MKTILSITCALLMSVNLIYAQDKIVFKDGKIIEGKIIEVTPADIKYKNPSLPDGPLYIVSKRELNSLIFENGTIELIQNSQNKKGVKEIIPQKNRIVINYFIPYVGSTDEMRTFTTLGIWYERRLNSFFSVKIPFEINTASYNQSFMIGFMPKFYFNRNKIIQGFAGPEILIGVGKDRYYNYYYNYYDYNYSATSNTSNRPAFMNTAAANVGMSINPVERFNITMDMGLGVNVFNYFSSTEFQDQNYPKFLFKLGLGMGYNF